MRPRIINICRPGSNQIRVLPEALWEPRDFVITAHIAIAGKACRHRRMGRRAHLPKAYPDGSRTPIRSHRRVSISCKLERAEAELLRLRSLKEIRGARWSAASQLDHSVADWVLHGGIPANCVLEAV